MGLIGTMAITIIGDTTSLEKDLKKAQRTLDGFASSVTSVGKTLTAGLTVPIVAAGAAAFKMAADLQDAVGATDQVFKAQSQAMQNWADSLPSYYGIAEAEALSYANTMGSMLKNIGGMTEEQAAQQSQKLIALAGDLTAMYGGTTQDAVRALTGSLKGNNTMLDNYGMAVNDAMIKTKAFEMGLYSGKGEMDLATKQAATLALIMEQTGDAQGQAAREADGASGSMRAFVTEMKNLATDIGSLLLPILTPLIANLRDVAAGFGQMSEGTKKTILVIAGIAAAIGPALIAIGMMASGLSSMIGLWTSLGGVLTAAGTTFGALVLPIAAVVAAIAAVGIALVDLWKNNEEFRTNVLAIWSEIQMSFTTIVTYLQGLWDQYGKHIVAGTTAIWNVIKTIISTVTQVIAEIINLFLKVLSGDWAGAWESVKNIFSLAWEGIIVILKNMVIAIKEIFLGLIKSALQWGADMVRGFWDGIASMGNWLMGKVKDFIGSIKDAFTDGFEIESPSKVMANIGKNISLGLAKGMTDGIGAIKNAVPDMVGAVTLSPALAGTGTNNSYGGATIYMTVYASNWSDIERELNRRGVRI